MTKMSIAGALAAASTIAAFGCQGGSEDELEIRVSAIGGAMNIVSSPVRGYVRPSGAHAAVYRRSNGDLERVSGTPFSQVMFMGSSVADLAAPWGYLRDDGEEAIVNVGSNRHVRESRAVGGGAGGTPSFGTRDYSGPPTNAPLAAPAPMNGPVPDAIPYRRADGQSAVVYRSESNHVIELLHQPVVPGGWIWTDLTLASNATVTANMGSPFPYARTDNYSTVVYIGSDQHIHELASTLGGPWSDGDLSAAAGDLVAPASDPSGIKRSDQFNAVQYIGADNVMHQLSLLSGGFWSKWTLPAVSPIASLHGRPSAYVKANGVNAIAYLSAGNQLHELTLGTGGWSDAVLPVPAGVTPKGQMFGHSWSTNRNSITFRGLEGGIQHGYDINQQTGGSWTVDTIF
jgi:hypothetical protein